LKFTLQIITFVAVTIDGQLLAMVSN